MKPTNLDMMFGVQHCYGVNIEEMNLYVRVTGKNCV